VIRSSTSYDKNEVVFELGKQPYFFFDFNSETVGHNRRHGEGVLEYIKRVMKSEALYGNTDFALPEFCPVHMKDVNARLSSSMNNKTYYFSYAAGIKNKNKMK